MPRPAQKSIYQITEQYILPLLAGSFTLGVLSAIRLPSVPLKVGVVAFVSAFLTAWTFKRKSIFYSSLMFAWLALGFCFFSLSAKRLPHAIEHWAAPASARDADKISIVGRVVSPPEIKTSGKRKTVSFKMQAYSISAKNNYGYERGRVEGIVQVFLMNPGALPEYQDKVKLYGELKVPKSSLNPGQFDYKRYLANENIYSVFYGYGHYACRVMHKKRGFIVLQFLYQFRLMLKERLENLLSPVYAQLSEAFLLGYKKNIPQEVRNSFMRTGTAHLLAISGLHITLIVGLVFTLFIILRIPKPMAGLLSMIFVFLYVPIGGSGIPIKRAAIMHGVSFLSMALSRSVSFHKTFSLAWLILLAIHPKSILSLSFQLSFFSIFCFVYLMSAARSSAPSLKTILKSSAMMSILIAPIILYYFQIFSPVSIIANVIVSPIFFFSLVGGGSVLLLGSVPLLKPVLVFMTQTSLELLMRIVDFFAHIKHMSLFISPPSIWHLLAIYGSFGLYVYAKRQKFKGGGFVRKISFIVYLFSFSIMLLPLKDKTPQLTFLSVGKNEVAHLQAGPYSHWLINTGRGVGSSQVSWVILPYLRYLGINRLEGIICSDTYREHTSGFESIHQEVDTGYLLYPESPKPLENYWNVNQLELRGHEMIETKGGVKLHVVAVIDARAIILLESPKWKVLFLPKMNEEVLKALKESPKALSSLAALYLYSKPFKRNENKEEILNRFIDFASPKSFVQPAKDKGVEAIVKKHDLHYFPLSETGALKLKHAGNIQVVGHLTEVPITL